MSEQAESSDDLSRLAWTEPSLPHGAGMRWISRAALGADTRTGYARARFPGNHPLVRDGALLQPAIIELLAQAAAAIVSLQTTATGGATQVKEGMLVAMRELVIVHPVPIDVDILLCVHLEKTFGTFTSARLEARSSGGDELRLAHASMTFFIKMEA